MGQTVNLLSFDFGGSNPSAPTCCSLFKGKGIFAGIAQLVECQPSKLNVASSSLVARSSRSLNLKFG